MIIIRVTGGLGNQLFQYIHGQSLQKKYNQKVVYDLTWYNLSSTHRHRQLEGHESFRLSAFGIQPEMLSEQASNFFNHKVGKLVNLVHFAWINQNKKPIIPAYFLGYWHGETYFENIRNEITQMLTLPPITNKDALKYKKQIEDVDVAVSMHIRRGDYENYPHLQVCTPEYYNAAISYLNNKLSNYRIFVFSDDISYCRNVLSSHQNITFIENGGSDLDEFQLMSLCDHHVISNSTFSWWTAWLGENRADDGRMILAPNRWFNHVDEYARHLKYHDISKIIPSRWIKIAF